jgi:hypothetical protein
MGNRCAQCGLPVSGDSDLCPHHHAFGDGDWAAANRIMCDLLHRGVRPPRLNEVERNSDDFWAVDE